MNRFGEYLEHHGIKPSVQRLRIYEYLYRNRIHPTVDTIYSALSPSMPTLSRTTVYNTMKLFLDKGVATAVNIEDNELRFDADTSIHGHFKCVGCETVFDFPVGKNNIEMSGLDSYQITEYQINLKGYCKVCKPLVEASLVTE